MRRAWLILALLSAAQARAAVFPDISPGGASAAMGDSVGMLSGSLESFWYNPASLASLKSLRLSASGVSWPGGSLGEFVSAGFAPRGWPVLGLSLANLGASDTLRDEAGVEHGDFSVSANALKLGLAQDFGRLSAGASLELDRSSVNGADEAQGFLNAGAQMGFARHLLGSLALRRLSTGASATQSSPLELRLGLGEHDWLLERLFVSAELSYLSALARTEWHLGGQYKVNFDAKNFGVIRAGYNSARAAAGGLAGLSLGLGMTWGMLGLDYAYLPLNLFGDGHRFGATLYFE